MGSTISAIRLFVFLSNYGGKDIRVQYNSTGNTFCIDFIFSIINPVVSSPTTTRYPIHSYNSILISVLDEPLVHQGCKVLNATFLNTTVVM